MKSGLLYCLLRKFFLLHVFWTNGKEKFFRGVDLLPSAIFADDTTDFCAARISQKDPRACFIFQPDGILRSQGRVVKRWPMSVSKFLGSQIGGKFLPFFVRLPEIQSAILPQGSLKGKRVRIVCPMELGIHLAHLFFVVGVEWN